MYLVQFYGGLLEGVEFCILNVDSFGISKEAADFLLFPWPLLATAGGRILSWMDPQPASMEVILHYTGILCRKSRQKVFTLCISRTLLHTEYPLFSQPRL